MFYVKLAEAKRQQPNMTAEQRRDRRRKLMLGIGGGTLGVLGAGMLGKNLYDRHKAKSVTDKVTEQMMNIFEGTEYIHPNRAISEGIENLSKRIEGATKNFSADQIFDVSPTNMEIVSSMAKQMESGNLDENQLMGFMENLLGSEKVKEIKNQFNDPSGTIIL